MITLNNNSNSAACWSIPIRTAQARWVEGASLNGFLQTDFSTSNHSNHSIHSDQSDLSDWVDRKVTLYGKGVELSGILSLPPKPKGVVIFAHGSGSGRLSPRNRQVAETLNEAGLGTLLFDLLTEVESVDQRNVFDIPLLSSRLVLATQWLKKQRHLPSLPIAYFGASTGAAAALWAASELGDQISSVVSRGGRPDLAIPVLSKANAPTLLLVGGYDEIVLELNEEAMKYLPQSNLVVIPGATHLFEEPGALEAVADEASNWFSTFFKKGSRREAA